MLNQVAFTGRLKSTPTLKENDIGKFIQFILIVPRDYKNSSGEIDADYLNCFIKEEQAKYLAKYGRQGNIITVAGKLETENINKRIFYQVKVKELYLPFTKIEESDSSD